jgi:AraC-like DNA-binding protein
MENIYYEYCRDTELDMPVFEGKSSNAHRHFHRAIEILYVEDGEVECCVGDESFIAEPDTIIFVHNYYIHSFKPKTEYKKLVFIVTPNFESDFNKMLKSHTLGANLTDKEFNRREIRPFFEKLYNDQAEMPRLVKKGYINIILGMLFDHYPTSSVKTSDGMEIMVDILHYIDLHYREPITLESIAGAFGYNKCYFSRMFNRYIGESLSNYVNIVRLREFMERAKEKDAPAISKLASECGFVSMPTFYRAFAKLYGESPNSYLSKK